MTASALYEGRVRHRRFEPVAHSFTYRVYLAYLDLAELPGVLDAHPWWSARHRAPVWYRRADYHGDPAIPLDQAIRDRVEDRQGSRPAGPVRLLANLRTFGWNFNPLAVYYCFEPDGAGLHSIVVEVTNTPWGDRHAYVFDGAEALAAHARTAKALHVSPFLPMDVQYGFESTLPGTELHIRLAVGQTFDADLWLGRLPLDRPTMTRTMIRHPLMPQRVSAGIYLQALRLRAKGVPVHRRPQVDAGPVPVGPDHPVGTGR